MSTQVTPPILQNPDIAASYQAAYDSLGKAYWEASSIEAKDQIYGAQQAIGEIITALDEQDLAQLTAEFVALKPKIDATNKALQVIKDDINKITKNISTAGIVVSAISKVISLLPA